MTLLDEHLISTYEGKKIYAVICYDTVETLPCFLKLPEAIEYARNYPMDAEVLEYKVKDGGPVKTGVGYYPYKDSWVMVKARKL